MDNKTGSASNSNRLVNSELDLTYPDEFDPLCPGCRSLDGMYGPEDTELADHIRHGHRDPDLDAELIPFVAASSQIDEISFALTEYGLI